MASIFNLNGKTAIVTGSSRGIGKEIAKHLVFYGANVVISSRDLVACENTASEINSEKKQENGVAFPIAAHIGKHEDLKKLVSFHQRNKSIMTLTAVRPPARFGAIKVNGNLVNYFKEKSKADEGWINGGFFVVEPKFLKYIKNDKTYLEREPFERITKNKQSVTPSENGPTLPRAVGHQPPPHRGRTA